MRNKFFEKSLTIIWLIFLFLKSIQTEFMQKRTQLYMTTSDADGGSGWGGDEDGRWGDRFRPHAIPFVGKGKKSTKHSRFSFIHQSLMPKRHYNVLYKRKLNLDLIWTIRIHR